MAEKNTYQEAIETTVTQSDNTELKVTMNPPNASTMMGVEHLSGEITKEVNVIANLSGVTVSVIGALPLKEYLKLSKVLQDFLS